jgi:hypothetical protein
MDKRSNAFDAEFSSSNLFSFSMRDSLLFGAGTAPLLTASTCALIAFLRPSPGTSQRLQPSGHILKSLSVIHFRKKGHALFTWIMRNLKWIIWTIASLFIISPSHILIDARLVSSALPVCLPLLGDCLLVLLFRLPTKRVLTESEGRMQHESQNTPAQILNYIVEKLSKTHG